MSQVMKPFKGHVYNQEKAGDLSNLVCPPYDIISPALLRDLRKRSPYNFIKVTLDKKQDYDSVSERFNKWIADDILVKDEQDCIYLYEQQFTLESKKHSRFGFIALLELDREGLVIPHEKTLSAPKKDRFNLLKKIKANLSPIFVISDKNLVSFADIISRFRRKKADMDFYDDKKIRNRVWKISDPELVKALAKEMSRRKLFIADGHHRFSVASQYFKKYGNKYKDLNYMPAYFTDPDSGLLIMPTHRVATVEEKEKDILDKLSAYFEIKEVEEDYLRRKIRGRGKIFAFGLAVKKKLYFLSLKNSAILDTIFVKEDEKIYKKLDVSILHKLVFSLLQVSDIEYTHKIAEVKTKVKGARVGFLVRATPLDTVFDLARNKSLLPQKSTYFYPKLLSGLVVRRFEA